MKSIYAMISSLLLILLTQQALAVGPCPKGADPKHTTCIPIKEISWLKSYNWQDGTRSQVVKHQRSFDMNIKVNCRSCKYYDTSSKACKKPKKDLYFKYEFENVPSFYSVKYVEKYEVNGNFSKVTVNRYFDLSQNILTWQLPMTNLPVHQDGCYKVSAGSHTYEKASFQDAVSYIDPTQVEYDYTINNEYHNYNGITYLWTLSIDFPSMDKGEVLGDEINMRVPNWHQLEYRGDRSKMTGAWTSVDEKTHVELKGAKHDAKVLLSDFKEHFDGNFLAKDFNSTTEEFFSPNLDMSSIKFYLAWDATNGSEKSNNNIYLYMTTSEDAPPVQFVKQSTAGVDPSTLPKRALLVELLIATQKLSKYDPVDFELLYQPIQDSVITMISASNDQEMVDPAFYMYYHYVDIALKRILRKKESIRHADILKQMDAVINNMDLLNKYFANNSSENGMLVLQGQAIMALEALDIMRNNHRQTLDAPPAFGEWINDMIFAAKNLTESGVTGDVSKQNINYAKALVKIARSPEYPGEHSPKEYLNYMKSKMGAHAFNSFSSQLNTMERTLNNGSYTTEDTAVPLLK